MAGIESGRKCEGNFGGDSTRAGNGGVALVGLDRVTGLKTLPRITGIRFLSSILNT